MSANLTRREFIHVAPYPGFSRLNRTHQRVLSVPEVLGGMFVFRRVTAPHVPAFEAEPQVHPGVSEFDAFLAHMSGGGCDLDLVEVGALSHGFLRADLSQLASWMTTVPRMIPTFTCGHKKAR